MSGAPPPPLTTVADAVPAAQKHGKEIDKECTGILRTDLAMPQHRHRLTLLHLQAVLRH